MLERWARGHDRRLATRAAAILASADGVSNKEVAARCAMTKQTVGKWRSRFRVHRLQGLYDEPRPGAPRRITDEQVARVIRLTAERAPNGAPWTTRSMAQAVGLTQTAISRIWRTHGVRPPTGKGAPPEARPSAPEPEADHAIDPFVDAEGRARARTLTAIQNLLRDARALRRNGPAEFDPMLALAIDAIEGALEKQREPQRSLYARTETALRNARHLLDLAEAAARDRDRSRSEREAAASAAVAAIRSVADGLRARVAPSPHCCPHCGTRYTLRFLVKGMGGEVVTSRLPCPRTHCRTPIPVQIPRNAERVRLEEATAS
jgi:transposase